MSLFELHVGRSAIASPSRVCAFSRTRRVSSSACHVARSTTAGTPGVLGFPTSCSDISCLLRVSRWGYATVGAASGSAASIVRYGTAPGEGAGAGLPGQRLAPFIGHIRDHGLGALL